MSESATAVREVRRTRTLHRISLCAKRLTARHGFDGFTMDDLAAAAEVSRRTLFNYYPGKLDAILGPPPELEPEVLEQFTAGGPHGDLFADLGFLASALLSDREVDRETIALTHRLFTRTPRLFAAAQERFETLTEGFVELVLAREGPGFGADRARLLLRLVVAVFEVAMLTFVDDEDGDRELAEVFAETLHTARGLLG